MGTIEEWKDYCHERGTSGDMVFDILKDWQLDESGKAVDDLAQELDIRERNIAELNRFLGLIARELGEEKWHELLDIYEQWKKEHKLLNRFEQWKEEWSNG